MSLLDKFSAVEIKADSRISEEDRDFCRKHQKVYLEAREGLIALKKKWKELYDSQMAVMEGLADSEYTRDRYIKVDYLPKDIAFLVGYDDKCSSSYDFDYEKLKKIRMFKNHRVDVKFASKELAHQFAEKYLGLVA